MLSEIESFSSPFDPKYHSYVCVCGYIGLWLLFSIQKLTKICFNMCHLQFWMFNLGQLQQHSKNSINHLVKLKN